jgi:hypothetical protein
VRRLQHAERVQRLALEQVRVRVLVLVRQLAQVLVRGQPLG